VPAGLLHAHNTKESVWGKIVVLEGRLQHTIREPEQEIVILDESRHGVVEPTVLHEAKPLGKMRCYVELHC